MYIQVSYTSRYLLLPKTTAVMALSNYPWDCNSYNSGSISVSSHLYIYIYPFYNYYNQGSLSLSIYIHTSVSSHLKSMKDYKCALPITSPEESLYHHLSSSNQFLAPRNLQTAQWERAVGVADPKNAGLP